MVKKVVFKYGGHWFPDLQLVAERLNQVIDEQEEIKKELAELYEKLGLKVQN